MSMATNQRAADRGNERGFEVLRRIGTEIRLARRSHGLSLRVVAKEARISAAELSRVKRALVPGTGVVTLARLCAVVGLDLSARAYPRGTPIRDTRHAALLTRFRSKLHPSLRWSTEVPLPNPGDQRAWDAMIRGDGWRYGTEAELYPMDGQALIRRLTLKQRDGAVDGVILLLPDTRQARLFRHEFADLLASDFPISARTALEQLRAGADPGGSAIVII